MNGDRRELFHADGFAHALGAELVERDSAWEVELTLAAQHLNFLGMCHGSVYFALSDIALSLVSNAEQTTAVAVDASISFMRSAREGDTLRASAKPERTTRSLSWYRIEVTNAEGELMATFSGTVYRPSH